MAASLNRVFVMGNLTRDPEVKYTPKGTAVGDLAIAVNESYKAQDGSIKETVTYIDIEVWGRTAENCKQYLSKGRPIFVEGSLKLDQWETPQGEKRSRLKVRALSVQFLGGGERGPGGGGNSGGGERRSYSSGGGEAPSRPAQASAPSDDRPPTPDDDDIPF